MKKGWKTEPLGELCDIRNGSTPSKGNPDFWDGGTIPWFTIDDMREQGREISSTRQKITKSALSETSVKLLPEDSVLLCCTASVGEFAITRIPLTTNQQFNGLVVKNQNQLDPNFLFHYASTLKDELLGLSGKTTIDFIPISRLRDVVVPVPPLAEQQRIVGLLDEAFEGLATAKANAEKNLQNARALFESHLQSVFTQRGPGWVETTLDKATAGVFTGPFGSLLHKHDYVENGIPLVNPAHITDTGIEPDMRKTVSEATAKRLANYIMREGDVVIGRRGEMGRCALVTEVEDGWLCGTGSFYIKPSDRCGMGYLVRYLRSEGCRKQLEALAAGAVMPNLSNTALGGLSMFLPPLRKQKEIVEGIDALHEETQRLARLYERKLAALEALKKSLLHQAFTGEL